MPSYLGGENYEFAWQDHTDVRDYGFVGNNTADDTTAINNALAGLPNGVGTVFIPACTFKTTGTITIGPGQTIQGSNALYGTTNNYAGTGVAWQIITASYQGGGPNQGAAIKGITIDGTNAGNTSTGLQYGDMGDGEYNVAVKNFAGTGSIGILHKNITGWAERTRGNATLGNCTTNVVFDGNGGSSHGSFDYSDFTFHLGANSNQDGLILQNVVQTYGTRFKVTGNFQTGAGNTGTALKILDTSFTRSCNWDISVETDGSTGTGHADLNIASGAQLGGYGQLKYLKGNTVDWVNGSRNGSGSNITFNGYIDTPLLGRAAFADVTRSYGNLILTNGSMSGGTMFGGGNIMSQVLANGANAGAVGSNWPTTESWFFAVKLKQPSSGAAGTYTWPSYCLFAGGTKPTLTVTNNAVDWFYFIANGDGTATCVGQALNVS